MTSKETVTGLPTSRIGIAIAIMAVTALIASSFLVGIASAQNPDADCWLQDGGTADNCEEKSNAEKSAEYADSYYDDCSGWRGWVWPSCWAS